MATYAVSIVWLCPAYLLNADTSQLNRPGYRGG